MLESVPQGAQADQFLHAYYYNFVIKKGASTHRALFEQNINNPQGALEKALTWWQQTLSAPSGEDRQLYEWSPAILHLTTPEKLESLSEEEFIGLCCKIHAFRNHSRQIKYSTLSLAQGEFVVDGEDKIRKGAAWVYKQRSLGGKSAIDVLSYLLHSGSPDTLPTRLWEIENSHKWKIPHFGLSTLGELTGWALPDIFPPRNGRTNKALYALGFPVRLYSA